MILKCNTSQGIFGVTIVDGAVSRIFFPGYWDENICAQNVDPLVDKLAHDLNRYFDGERIDWKTYPLYLSGNTEFQIKVWRVLQSIPYGATLSYSDVASLTGTRAWRAVGTACKKNPIPILIPCHRVIRKNGYDGGFSAGTRWKQFLLKLENK